MRAYVRFTDRLNETVGGFAKYLIFLLMGILIYEVFSRTIFNKPHIWQVEMSAFTMTAYYMLGGAYTLIREGHVRMDLFHYKWSARGKAAADVITFPIIMVYMAIYLYGSITSLQYALEYRQVTYSSWGPPLAPIKFIMLIGIALMTMQMLSEFFKALLRMRGRETTR
jgi:TRAP-type mannitol/chloroaromatic compound transport system permease small subunit